MLSIWGHEKVQEELDGAVRNKAVFEKLARKMAEMGFNKDWKQCRAKIKNLKVSYKAVKDHNNRSGRGRKLCRYFKELDEILGNPAATRPPEVLEKSITIERATKYLDLVDDEQQQASGLVIGGGGNSDGEDSLI